MSIVRRDEKWVGDRDPEDFYRAHEEPYIRRFPKDGEREWLILTQRVLANTRWSTITKAMDLKESTARDIYRRAVSNLKKLLEA